MPRKQAEACTLAMSEYRLQPALCPRSLPSDDFEILLPAKLAHPRTRTRWVLCLPAAICALSLACARVSTPAEIPPYQTLLRIVTDFERYGGVDLYRFETPQDISGQNAFRAALARLQSFQETCPGQNEDIARFVRGEAWMRLGEFAKAGESFRLVAGDAASSLSAQAARKSGLCIEFQNALRKDGPSSGIEGELAAFEQRIQRLADLEKRLAGAYEACLARREREKTETEYALFLFRNSAVIARGKQRALELAERMIRDHAPSRLIQAHRLRLGGFYLELARDMVELNPPDRTGFDADAFDRPAFDLEAFNRLTDAAEQQFLLVSRADGYDEKLEGAALLRQTQFLRRRVLKMAR